MCPERYFWSLSFNKRRLQQQSTMVATGAKLVISLLFVGALYTTDAAITAWSTPNIAGAADGTGTLDIAEDKTTGATIETFKATGGTNPEYTLAQAVSPFALATTGELTITAALDHETTQTYTLLIVATDTDDSTGTATVTVSVTDVNEHDPVFSASSYSHCIVDASTADTTLTTITATDQDTSQTLAYTINSMNNGDFDETRRSLRYLSRKLTSEAGDTNTDFKIDGSTGLIQVNDAKTLAKATTATYDLVIHAVDNVATFRTGSTTVSVTVSDSCSSGTIVALSMMMLIVSLCVALF